MKVLGILLPGAFALVAAAGSAPAASSPGQTLELTIDRAAVMALAGNDKVRQYEERLAERKFDARGAVGAFLPSIGLCGGYTHLDNPLTFDLDPIRSAMLNIEAANQVNFASIASQMAGGPAITDPTSAAYQAIYDKAYAALGSQVPDFIDTLQKQNFPSAAVTAVLPLFTGGRIVAGVRAAAAEERGSSFELDDVRNRTLQETVDNYMTVVLLDNVVAVRGEVRDAMLVHCSHAEKLAAQGSIARYHLLRAKVAVAEAERDLADEKDRLAIALMALRKSLALDENADIRVSDSLVYLPLPDSVDPFEEAAAAGQPLLGLIGQKKIIASEKVAGQRGALLPQIAAFGRYELFPSYLSALDPKWVVGVNATVPLFAGGRNIASLRSANHLVREVEALESSTRRDVSLWVTKAYREMRAAEQRYLRSDADRELSAENLRQCRSRFDAGYGTSLEVIDAQLTVERNRIDRLVALFDYYRSMTDLYTAAGHTASVVALLSPKGSSHAP
jgi:outer membrane protein TolC